MICMKKNWKKSFFKFFFFKINADHLSSNTCFSNLCQKILKLSSPVLWKRFEIKSHQRRAHYLNLPRNGGRLTAGGGFRSPPPVWLGLSWSNMQILRHCVIVLFKQSLKFSSRLRGAKRTTCKNWGLVKYPRYLISVSTQALQGWGT